MTREMKNSGIDWIGQIPADWKIGRVKNAFTRKNEKAQQEEPTILSLARSGVKVRDVSTGEGQIAESYYNYNPVEPFDLLLNPMDLYSGANCSISKVSGVISPAYINLKANEEYYPVFYDYYFKTQYWAMAFFAHGKGVSYDNRWTLSSETLMNYYIPVPSFTEQKKIADFLDSKVTEIDKMIAETKSSIENYKEYKSAIIDETITKGNFPQYKFRYLGELKNGLNYHSASDEKTIKFLGVGDFKNFMVLDSIDCFSDLPIDTEISDEYFLKSGDIVFVRSNGSKELVGRSIMVDNIDYDLTYSGFCIRFRNENSEKVRNKYLLYFFRSEYFKECLKQGSSGMAINNLSQDILNSVRVPIPSIEKQDEIINHLDLKCTEIENLISEKEALVSNLEEYKKTLIYEYVTGKKAVL